MKFRLFSEYCGLGASSGEPHHYVDQLCQEHDDAYQALLDQGEDPYTHWNDADEDFMHGLRQLQHRTGGLRETVTGLGAMGTFKLKKLFTTLSGRSLSNLQGQEQMMRTGHKREHGELHHNPDAEAKGMEPEGHGNAPATGTHIAGYVEKYVPVNFPDKITLKQRWTNNIIMRCAATAGATAADCHFVLATNDIHAPMSVTSNIYNPLGAGHGPNQRTNWISQYGYYRVTQFDYRITVTNISGTTFTQTANPPGAFTNPVQSCDGVFTLMKTQNSGDFLNILTDNLWEQKLAHNVVLQARSPGATKTMHIFHGTITPEEFDIDPVATAGDETWTSVGSSPATIKLIGGAITPLLPYTTTALLPEVGVAVFFDCTYTVQYAGYKTSLRQVAS